MDHWRHSVAPRENTIHIHDDLPDLIEIQEIPHEGPPQPGQVIFITPGSPDHPPPAEYGDTSSYPAIWGSNSYLDLTTDMAWASADQEEDSDEEDDDDYAGLPSNPPRNPWDDNGDNGPGNPGMGIAH